MNRLNTGSQELKDRAFLYYDSQLDFEYLGNELEKTRCKREVVKMKIGTPADPTPTLELGKSTQPHIRD